MEFRCFYFVVFFCVDSCASVLVYCLDSCLYCLFCFCITALLILIVSATDVKFVWMTCADSFLYPSCHLLEWLLKWLFCPSLGVGWLQFFSGRRFCLLFWCLRRWGCILFLWFDCKRIYNLGASFSLFLIFLYVFLLLLCRIQFPLHFPPMACWDF